MSLAKSSSLEEGKEYILNNHDNNRSVDVRHPIMKSGLVKLNTVYIMCSAVVQITRKGILF